MFTRVFALIPLCLFDSPCRCLQSRLISLSSFSLSPLALSSLLFTLSMRKDLELKQMRKKTLFSMVKAKRNNMQLLPGHVESVKKVGLGCWGAVW